MIPKITSIIIFLFAAPFFVGAAELYLDADHSSMRVGDIIEVSLMLDAEEDVVNALEGSVSFSQNLIVRQIRYGNSLIQLWMQKPIQKGDSIVYAGIVPGGYSGEISPHWKGNRPGKILSIVFEATKIGDGWVQVNRDSIVLLHDGIGTEASLIVRDMNIEVTEGEGIGQKEVDWGDKVPPESFTPIVIRKPDNFLTGKYYIVFDTQDKNSGVHHYEVKERGTDYIVAESPYLLKNQRFDQDVTVVAFDNAGNVRIEIVPAHLGLAWYDTILTRGILLSIVFSILLIISVRMYKKRGCGHSKT
ncbi:MAG: hypothetical protein KAI72_06790 [Candidatus Pacebacteria bacterium]|nr:hypothetical protein [Candidatus Paceibacterota bacterium]